MTSKQTNCHETLTDIQYTLCLLITLLLQTDHHALFSEYDSAVFQCALSMQVFRIISSDILVG